ncbi:hypothetical protein G6F22_010603 [Rhizopus arrhizus]|nr:hypothetical protein G6F22_010603 [Rhizopus arrhizus]
MVEAADLAGRDVGVVRAGQVAGFGRAQEAKAVRQDFQHAVGGDAVTVAGQHLQQGKDDVLLAGAGDAFGDLQLLGDFQQLLRRHALEVAQRVDREALGHVGMRARHEGLLLAAVVGHAIVAEAVVAVTVAAVAETVAAVALTLSLALLAVLVVRVLALVLATPLVILLARLAGFAALTTFAAATAGRGLGGGRARRRGCRRRHRARWRWRLDDASTRACVEAERAMNRALHGSCHVPVAAIAQWQGNDLHLQGLVGSASDGRAVRAEAVGPASDPDALGQRCRPLAGNLVPPVGCSCRPAAGTTERRTGAFGARCLFELVDHVHRGQRVGLALVLGHVTVVTRLPAGFQRQVLVHAHRDTEVILAEGVVRTGFDQQGVDQVGVVGQRVLQVEQAATDHAGTGAVVLGAVGAAHTGADLRVEGEALGVPQAGAVAQAERTLAVVGGEVVALGTHRRGQLAVLAQLQRAAGAAGVAVGGGVVATGGGAVVGGLGHLRARAQAEQVHAVHPVAIGVAQAQAAIEAFGAAVAACRCEAELAAAAAPRRGHRRQFGGILCIRERRAQQQGNQQGHAQGHRGFSEAVNSR